MITVIPFKDYKKYYFKINITPPQK